MQKKARLRPVLKFGNLKLGAKKSSKKETEHVEDAVEDAEERIAWLDDKGDKIDGCLNSFDIESSVNLQSETLRDILENDGQTSRIRKPAKAEEMSLGKNKEVGEVSWGFD